MKLNKNPIKRKRVSDFGEPAPKGAGLSEVLEVLFAVIAVGAVIYLVT